MCFNTLLPFGSRVAFAEWCAWGDRSVFAVASQPTIELEQQCRLPTPQKDKNNHLLIYIPLKSFS